MSTEPTQRINVEYCDNKCVDYPDLDSIERHADVKKILCRGMQIKELPKGYKFPKLKTFISCNVDVEYFNGTKRVFSNIASIEDPVNVKKLFCGSMKFKTLPSLNFPNLEEFDCHNNELESLPDVLDFPRLRYFDCSDNRLTRLPENMHFPALQFFDRHKNMLTHLPKAITCPNLRYFYCCDNQLTTLPDYIVYWKQMVLFIYDSNPILTSEITEEQSAYFNELKKNLA